jgi:hypothetical protein
VEDYQAKTFGVAIAAPGLGIDEMAGVIDAGDRAGAHSEVGFEIGIKGSGVLVVGNVMFFKMTSDIFQSSYTYGAYLLRCERGHRHRLNN